MKLKNKVALITGAGMGQGREAALLFAKEGAKLVLGDVNADAGKETAALLNKTRKNSAVFVKCDVSKEADCKRLVREGVKAFGKLDVIYNNAGILNKNIDKSVINTTEEAFDKVMGVNLKGPFFICKYGIPELRKAGGGSIVNIGSISALTGSTVPQDVYAPSKCALIVFTKSIAIQFAREKIRCNIIHPGMVDTPMQRKYMENPAWLQAVIDDVPMGRFAAPIEIAKVALFLASDDSSYVTGAEIIVDGGFCAK